MRRLTRDGSILENPNRISCSFFGANPDNYELLSLSRNGDPECKPDTQDFYFRVEKSLPKLREQTAGKWSGTRPKRDTETEIDAKEGRENQLTG